MEEWDSTCRATSFPIKKSYSNLLSSLHLSTSMVWELIITYNNSLKALFLVGPDSQVLDLSFEQAQNKSTLFTMWAVNSLYTSAFHAPEGRHFIL